jgi:hypothetical protein
MRPIVKSGAFIPIMAGAASVVALTCTSAAGQPASTAEAGWAAMQRCAREAGEAARHRCMDDVLRGAGLLPGADQARPAPAPAPQAAAERAAPVPAPAPASEPRSRFGLETSPARQARKARPAPSGPDRVEVTLSGVELDGEGKLVLTTSEGAVWRQVESDPVRPAPSAGQTMIIEKKSLGGFMCRPGRWAAFRCIRTS